MNKLGWRDRGKAAWAAVRGRAYNQQLGDRLIGSGSLTAGGIVNPSTGAGGILDKGEGNFFTPTRIYWRTPLEIICVQSSAANRFVNIPVDDMFIRWRNFSGDDDAAIEAMERAEDRHRVQTALRNAMAAARQYGTGVVVMMTKEADLMEPLMPERIREGDLSALQWFDRFDISVNSRDDDLYSPHLQEPVHYSLHPTHGGDTDDGPPEPGTAVRRAAAADEVGVPNLRSGLRGLATDPRYHLDHAGRDAGERDFPYVAGVKSAGAQNTGPERTPPRRYAQKSG